MPGRARTSDRRSIAIVLALLIAGLTGARLAAASPTSPGLPLSSHLHGKPTSTSAPPPTTTAPSSSGSSVGVPPGGPPLTGSITLTDQTFLCYGPLNLKSLQVTIDARSRTSAAVKLEKGCTGTIGSLVVHQSLGDGVDIGGASQLTIGGGSITCDGHSPGAHQDGIQVMSGSYVDFEKIYVACTSATNAQLYINEGREASAPPDHIYCNGCQFHPDPTHYHSVTIGASVDSGTIDSLVCPGSAPGMVYAVSPDAVDPVNLRNTFPASC
jgi:hypothetical protein